MKKFIYTCALLAFTTAGTANADEHASAAPDAEAMKKMMALSTPGAQHKVLESLVGEWDYTVTYRMAPDAPEQTSKGTSVNAWILDGRFIQQTVNGTMEMGDQTQTFEGIGYIGHDNLKNKYQSIWMDNMGTGTMVATGTYDAASKTLTESGHFSCAMKGAQVSFKSELKFVDADNYTFTMYDTGADGKSYQAMHIDYTRKK